MGVADDAAAVMAVVAYKAMKLRKTFDRPRAVVDGLRLEYAPAPTGPAAPFSMFTQVIRATIRTLLFQQGPQDFPYARDVTRTVLPIAVLANYLQLRLTVAPVAALALSMLELAALALAVGLLLNLRGLINRLQQTLNALFATNAVFTLMLLPLVAELAPLLKLVAEDPQALEQADLPAHLRFGMIGLSLWNLAVITHVLRHALGLGIGLGAGLAVCCTVFVYVAVQGASNVFA